MKKAADLLTDFASVMLPVFAAAYGLANLMSACFTDVGTRSTWSFITAIVLFGCAIKMIRDNVNNSR